MTLVSQSDQHQIQVLTEAGTMEDLIKSFFHAFCLDLLCRGQRAETIIPLENGGKFIVCLDDGKGVEQSCPKGLFYHLTSHRCERGMSFAHYIN
jgi:hypothetical protein